jgi:hypothetical protein
MSQFAVVVEYPFDVEQALADRVLAMVQGSAVASHAHHLRVSVPFDAPDMHRAMEIAAGKLTEVEAVVGEDETEVVVARPEDDR